MQLGTTTSHTQSRQKVSVEFTPQSGVTLGNGFTILNDRADYNDPATKTVVCDAAKLPSGITNANDLKGKTLKISGYATTYKGKPQIRAEQVALK